jgi:hypothetical protein
MPGTSVSAVRRRASISCLLLVRPMRGDRFSSSVALRDSGTPPMANGSLPVAPPPIAV